MARTQLRTLIALAMSAGTALGQVHYTADFQSGAAGPEWSRRIVDAAPLGGRRFLGQFGNDAVSLTLPGVRAGERVSVAFDFLAIRTWDGNAGGGGPGPDIFRAWVDGGPVLVNSTFAVGDPEGRHKMSYPELPGVAENPSRFDAVENDTLGYTIGPAQFPLDATWRMNFNFIAAANGLTVWFEGAGLQELADESWGLDNVTVTAVSVPAPGATALAGCGLGLILRRRRR